MPTRSSPSHRGARRFRRACRLVACVLLSGIAGCAPWLTAPSWTDLSWTGPSASGPSPPADRDAPVAEETPPSEASPAIESSTEPAATSDSLAVDGFVRTLTPATDAATEDDTFRWTHPALEQWRVSPRGRKADIEPSLDNPRMVPAANAAILLGRRGDPAALEHLVEAIGDTDLRDETRCAAAEALGRIQGPEATSALRGLIDLCGPQCEDAVRDLTHHNGDGSQEEYLRQGGRVRPEVYADLLYALARHVRPSEDPRFLAAATSPNKLVRLAVAETWLSALSDVPPSDPLPPEIVKLRYDADPTIRRRVMTIVAAHGGPEAFSVLRQGTADPAYRVQQAAYRGLGKLATPEALALLERGLGHGSELVRADAVAGLALAGREQEVLAALGDQSWRVRLEVARSLASFGSRAGYTAVRDCLEDACPMVQEAAVRSLAAWPEDKTAALLFDALRGRCEGTRVAAVEVLAKSWPPAERFPARGLREERTEALAALEDRYRREIGFVGDALLEQAAGALAPRGDATPSEEQVALVAESIRRLENDTLSADARSRIIESLAALPYCTAALERIALEEKTPFADAIYREVLPEVDPLFEILDRLAMADQTIRRRAASDLVAWSAEKPVSRLALARIARLCVFEDDGLVWLQLFRVIEHDPRPEAVRLVYLALEHKSPDLKLRACEYLTRYPSPRHAAYLAQLVSERNAALARAAVAALGAIRELPDRTPLEEALSHESDTVRVEAAAALARRGAASGRDALTRLAYSGDEHVRSRAAEAMGETPDPLFTPVLMHLLDDRQAIRRAALESLPLVVGHDVSASEGGLEPTTTHRIEAWKTWYARTAGASPRRL